MCSLHVTGKLHFFTVLVGPKSICGDRWNPVFRTADDPFPCVLRHVFRKTPLEVSIFIRRKTFPPLAMFQ